MSQDAFMSRFEDMPDALSIFPLAKAVLLPRQSLPLNIFEPRYLSMVFDALAADRHIGMIQPNTATGDEDPVPVYSVGCAGRITAFQETADGRLLINLTGVCRFEIAEEIEMRNGYRRVRPRWQPYEVDMETPVGPAPRLGHLEPTIKAFFDANEIQADWDALKKLSSASLVDFLSTNLPLAVEEKQALVEAPNVMERAEILKTALELGLTSSVSTDQTRH